MKVLSRKALMVGAALCTLTGAAFASTGSTSGTSAAPITNVQQISSCLCLESSYQSLNSQVSAKQAAYDQAVAQRAALDTQLASEKASAATPAQIDAIRVTSEKRIALQGQINDIYIPQLQQATAQYNSSVDQYQQSCAGKLFDTTTQAQVQSTLQCRG
jgi:hypothetical protein